MRPNVYTYYVPLNQMPDLWSPSSQRLLIDVWRRSWAKQGWNPVVLNETHARRHPRFTEFKKKFWELPTEYGHNYEGPCFMRWAAAAAVGGGLLVDYDVINYSFPPQDPDPHQMRILCDTTHCLFMGAALGTRQRFEDMCQLFFDWTPDQRDWNPNATPPMYHCSDLEFLHQTLEKKTRVCPVWLKKVDGCTLYPKISGSMVHYGYAMKLDGRWPKHQWIEKVRAF